ncbi:MAG: ABC transporter permease [Myxococcota bacterium]
MTAYLLQRLGWSVFILFAVLTLVFNLLFGIGDPAVATLGANARAEQLAQFRAQHGLDRPVWEQFTSYLGVTPCVRRASPAFDDGDGYCGVLQGRLGESFSHEDDVSKILLTRFPRTLVLGLMAMLFELLLGLTVGIVAAVRQHTPLDTGIMALAFLGISAPTFLTGLLFLRYVAFQAGWFPVGGYGVGFWEHIWHALLPAFTLAIVGAATYARIMRSEMIDNLGSDYVRTARAKGLHPTRVVMGHAFRNALLPIVTLMGLSMPILVSGAVITESIYAWPGMGRLAIEAINNLDLFTVMGVVLFASLMVQIGNLLADLAVAALDPRVGTGVATR